MQTIAWFLLLSLVPTFSCIRLAHAQSVPTSRSNAVTLLEKQCMAAKTTGEQFRQALPACVQLEVTIMRDPPSQERDLSLGRVFTQIARCEAVIGNVNAAVKYARRALALRKQLLNPEHADIAESLSDLAEALFEQGQYDEAETHQRQALAMRKRLLGSGDPAVVDSLNNLAMVLLEQGKYDESEKLQRQALDILKGQSVPRSADIAIALNNFAGALEKQGKLLEAETMSRQALDLWKKAFGPEHLNVALGLNNLAGMLEGQGKYSEAELLYRQALAMWQKLLGTENFGVALARCNIASALANQSRYGEAERLYREAQALFERILGHEHPRVAANLINLGRLLYVRGQLGSAIDLLREAALIRESQLRATVSETRMQAFLRSLRNEENTIYSLLLSSGGRKDVHKLALSLALLRKGRAAEAGMIANFMLHTRPADPAVQQLFDNWQSVQHQREKLFFSGPDKSPAEHQARQKDLQLQADALEAQLARALPEIRSLQLPTFDNIISSLARRLPRDGALVEVIWMQPYQPRASDSASRWGEPHLIAMVLTADQTISSVDLGQASHLDELGRKLLTHLRNPNSNPKPEAQAMYQSLLAPLLPLLVGKKELFLSLDGSLNLIPFDALHDGNDYLLGRYRFHYLTSGRDLLRQASQRPTTAALVLANPDFGKVVTPSQDQPPSLYQRLTGLIPLPAAQREAEQIATLVGVKPLLGQAAREEIVHDAHAPWILHLATHGLFLADAARPEVSNGRSGLLAVATPNASAPAWQAVDRLPGEASAMNRSALALAYVLEGDRANSSKGDGLLTAENSRSLDLGGTQLVTLSACETAKGTLSVGQGVYGLRRAFLVAGAETLVTSLWRVHDEATGELMVMYYQKLLDKKKPGDRLGSMVEAMQELRRRPERDHPYYWAPFLVIGQYGPLRR